MTKSERLLQNMNTRFRRTNYYECWLCGREDNSVTTVKIEHDKVGFICQKCLQEMGKLYLANTTLQKVHADQIIFDKDKNKLKGVHIDQIVFDDGIDKLYGQHLEYAHTSAGFCRCTNPFECTFLIKILKLGAQLDQSTSLKKDQNLITQIEDLYITHIKNVKCQKS